MSMRKNKKVRATRKVVKRERSSTPPPETALDPRLIRARFNAETTRRGPNECWPFSMKKFTLAGKQITSRRVAFWLANKRLPEGLVFNRTSCEKLCVNPAHLSVPCEHDQVEKSGLQVGSASSQSKFTEDQVREIRARHANGERNADLAREFGVHTATIYRLVIGQSYKDIK